MKYLETEKIELKSNLNHTFEKEVVAFLNSHDGVIYVGVENDGSICGVQNLDEAMKKISDIISTSIMPNPQELVKVRAVYVESKFIVEVEVKKGNALYYINKYGRSSKGCYIRVGTSCRSMTEEQIEKTFVNSIKALSYSLIKDRSPKQKLTFRIFKIFLDENNIYYDEENFNENNNFLTEKGEYNYQAYLLSDQCDISIKVSCWEGKNKLSNFLFKKEFGGCCLLKAMNDLSSYIQSTHNKVKSFFDKGKISRRDEFLFDFDAFREAWANACLHNDYSTHLGPAVYLFSDHLEIFSYGSPLKVQSKESFLKGISKPINPELATIFMKLGDAEESGKGINTIVRKYGKDIFKYSNTSLVIDIPYSHVHRESEDVHRDVQRENSDVHRKTDDVHRNVQRETGDVHRETDDVHRENSDVHRDVHRESDHVHRESNDVHRENSDVHRENSDVHRETDDVHRESNNPSKTKTIDIEEEQNKDIILKYDENLEYEITDIEKILKLINDNKNITLKEMSLAINKSIKSVQRILREYGKVKYHGKFKKGYWEIID